MVDIGHQRAVACDPTFETNDKKVLWNLYPILPPQTCNVFIVHQNNKCVFFAIPIIYTDSIQWMEKWNFNGLDCVNLEQEHEPPNMVDYVEECVQAQLVSQS